MVELQGYLYQEMGYFVVDKNKNNTQSKNASRSTSAAAYPFIGSSTGAPQNASTSSAKTSQTTPNNTKASSATNASDNKKNSFSPTPLPKFLENDAATKETLGSNRQRFYNSAPSASKEETEKLTNEHFAWVQEYLSSSNQYFFCVNKFTVFGLSGALFLLGVLFYVSGFLSALLLLPLGESGKEQSKDLLYSSGKNAEVILTSAPIAIPVQTTTIKKKTASPKKENIQILEKKKPESKNDASSEKKEEKAENKKISKTKVAVLDRKQTKTKTVEKKDPILKRKKIYKKEEKKISENSRDSQKLYQPKEKIKKHTSAHKDVANTSSRTIKNIAKNPQTHKLYKSLILFSTPVKSEALKKAQELRKKGYNVFVVYKPATKQNNNHYRVQMGAYKDKLFAENVLKFMKEQVGAGNISMSESLLKDMSEKIMDAR